MTTPDSDKKLVLAVQDEALRERLATLLAGEEVEVRYIKDLAEDQPKTIAADVVVLRADRLDLDELPEILETTDGNAPGVVVLDDDGAPEEEVRLVAAGATAVLDTTGDRGTLGDQLMELAEAEAEGGLQGPEAGGSVAHPKLADFQSRSPRMRDFLDVVRRVASSDSTLLITGETGVGKERLARAVHAESPRSTGPFVSVNCGALTESLLESELFGHVRGAFTGATGERKGHFEVANGGTIFLDEIGEMPQHLQVKLLTVLQRREVQPLGAQEATPVDVRVLAATNRDLEEDASTGRFREDLFFRLNVISLEIPPLRERFEDLPWLVGRFLRHFAEVHDRPEIGDIDRRALEALHDYSWPGNVRELVNTIERAVLLSEGDRIRLEDLPANVQGLEAAVEKVGTGDLNDALLEKPLVEARRIVTEKFERAYLEHHLRESGGIVSDVANRARINPRTLYEKMRRHDLKKEDFRPGK